MVVGSAVLFRVGHALFLFSAAHVFDEWGTELLIPGLDGPVRVEGQALKSTAPDGRRKNDGIDAVAVRLSAGSAGALLGVPALGPTEIDVNERVADSKKHYLLIGFPSTRAHARGWEKLLKCEGFVLTAPAGSSDAYAAAGVSDHRNIMLVFDPKDVTDASGPVTPPKLNGISGGGIWSLGARVEAPGNDAKLVGITVERRAEGGVTPTIIGTRIGLFVEIIRHEFAEFAHFLPPSMRIRIMVNGQLVEPGDAV